MYQKRVERKKRRKKKRKKIDEWPLVMEWKGVKISNRRPPGNSYSSLCINSIKYSIEKEVKKRRGRVRGRRREKESGRERLFNRKWISGENEKLSLSLSLFLSLSIDG